MIYRVVLNEGFKMKLRHWFLYSLLVVMSFLLHSAEESDKALDRAKDTAKEIANPIIDSVLNSPFNPGKGNFKSLLQGLKGAIDPTTGLIEKRFSSSEFMFQVGGALPIPLDLTAPGLDKKITFETPTMDFKRGMCDLFDANFSIANLVNGVTSGVRDVMEVAQAAFSSFLTSLPLYLLQKLDADLYNLLVDWTGKAQKVFDLHIASCEEMGQLLADNPNDGFSNYQYLLTKNAANDVQQSFFGGEDLVNMMKKSKQKIGDTDKGIDCACDKVKGSNGNCFAKGDGDLVVKVIIECSSTAKSNGGLLSDDAVVSDALAFAIQSENFDDQDVFIAAKSENNENVLEDLPDFISKWVGDYFLEAGSTKNTIQPSDPRDILGKMNQLCTNAYQKLIEDKIKANEFQITEIEALAVANCQDHTSDAKNILIMRHVPGLELRLQQTMTLLDSSDRNAIVALLASDAARDIVMNQIFDVRDRLIKASSSAGIGELKLYSDKVTAKLQLLRDQQDTLNQFFIEKERSRQIAEEIKNFINRKISNAGSLSVGTEPSSNFQGGAPLLNQPGSAGPANRGISR